MKKSSRYAASAPEVFLTGLNPDDFVFDVDGNLYGTTHLYNSVVRITPERVMIMAADVSQGLAGSTAAFERSDHALRLVLTVLTESMQPNQTALQPHFHRFGAAGDAELLEQSVDVQFYRAFRNMKMRSDFFVGLAFGN